MTSMTPIPDDYDDGYVVDDGDDDDDDYDDNDDDDDDGNDTSIFRSNLQS